MNDFEVIADIRTDQESLAAQEPEIEQEIIDAVDAEPVDGEDEGEQEDSQDSNEGETEPPLIKKDDPKGVQKRIGKLVKANKETQAVALEAQQRIEQLERIIQELAQDEQDAALPEAPDPDHFENWKDYLRATEQYNAFVNHKEQERAVKKAEREARATHELEFTKARSKYAKQAELVAEQYEDFYEVTQADDVAISPAMRDAIFESNHGAEIAYYLAKRPEEAQKLYHLRPVQAAIAIGKLESRFAKPSPKTVSKASAPAKNVSGGARLGSQVTYEDLSKAKTVAEYERIYKKLTGG